MTFWYYMTFMSIVVPLVLIIVGLYYTLCPPNKIYTDFGYKTALTLKNEEIWAFAHKYLGKLWIKLALIMIPITVAAMFIPRGLSDNAISIFSIALSAVQCIVVVFSFRHMKGYLLKHFDEKGNPRVAVEAKE